LGREYSVHEMRSTYKILGGNLKERPHLGDLGVDGGILLK